MRARSEALHATAVGGGGPGKLARASANEPCRSRLDLRPRYFLCTGAQNRSATSTAAVMAKEVVSTRRRCIGGRMFRPARVLDFHLGASSARAFETVRHLREPLIAVGLRWEGEPAARYAP